MSCNCNCNSNGSSSVQEQINELNSTIESIGSAVKFLTCGHPVLGIEDPDDIAQFNFSTGWGANCWEGWAIMNGTSYYSPTLKKNITTLNLFDKFLVGAGGTYAVGDTGGANSVTLDLTQIPSHNHTITDSGHTHNLTDPGHTHGIVDPQHSHNGTSDPHTHTLSIDAVGDHTHTVPQINASFTEGSLTNQGYIWDADTVPTTASGLGGAHTHEGIADPAALSVTTNDASTGISVQDAFIGITETDSGTTGISINNAGGGLSHENRPPYVAILFIKKIY